MVEETKDKDILRTLNDVNDRVYPKAAFRCPFTEQRNYEDI